MLFQLYLSVHVLSPLLRPSSNYFEYLSERHQYSPACFPYFCPPQQVDADEFMSLYAAVKKGEVSGLGGTSLLDGLTQNATKLAAGLGLGGGEKVIILEKRYLLREETRH